MTQLEMRAFRHTPVRRPRTDRVLRVEIVPLIPLSFYRYLYDSVGRAHHWTSRHLSDASLSLEIHGHGTSVHVLYADGAPAGWFELDAGRKSYETRIVHFAILPEFRGLGLAETLLAEAIAAAFRTRPVVVTIETNTLDHPAALPLYQRFGFVAVGKRTVATRAIDE